MTPNTIESGVQAVVNRNLLKYAAGANISCRYCGGILDWTRTVVATFKIGASESTKVLCVTCYDKARMVMEGKAKELKAGMEVIDGRDYAPKRAATKGAVRKQGRKLPSFDRLQEIAEEGSGIGFCVSCGEEHDACEPDARERKCEKCGSHTVYGAEEIIMQGLV